jgi:hypothetical protein
VTKRDPSDTPSGRQQALPPVELSVRSKYAIAAQLLHGIHGTLLDVGARDGVLRRSIAGDGLVFRTADLTPGCDVVVDLERGLAFEDGAFDYTVALDVLEHIEHIHAAFCELARVTRRQLLLGLPNFASLARRVRFLAKGHLGTDKYDLLPQHQGDRHRWLTTHAHALHFVASNAEANGFAVTRVIGEVEGARPWTRALGRAAAVVLPPGLVVGRDIVLLSRR